MRTASDRNATSANWPRTAQVSFFNETRTPELLTSGNKLTLHTSGTHPFAAQGAVDVWRQSCPRFCPMGWIPLASHGGLWHNRRIHLGWTSIEIGVLAAGGIPWPPARVSLPGGRLLGLKPAGPSGSVSLSGTDLSRHNGESPVQRGPIKCDRLSRMTWDCDGASKRVAAQRVSAGFGPLGSPPAETGD